jgi:hypothetical protein
MESQRLDFNARLIESVDRTTYAIAHTDPMLAAELSRLRRRLKGQQQRAAGLTPR